MADDAPETGGEAATGPAATAAPMEQPLTAKEKAAARRKRILEAGRTRMDVMAGEVVPKEAGGSPTAAGDAGAGEVAAGDEAAAAGAEGGAQAEEESSRPSGSARLKAMRLRRFKKAQAAKTDDGEGDDKPAATAEGETAARSAPVVEEEKKEAKPSPAAAGDGEAAPTAGDEKKYVGVAKMRRMRLAEQKKKAEAEASASDAGAGGGLKTSASGRKPVPPSLSTVERTALKWNRTPIFLHLLTAVLIFLGGLGLGMHSSPGNVGGMNAGAVLIDGYAPATEGIGILKLFGLFGGGAAPTETMDARDLLLQQGLGQEDDVSETDEFATKPEGAEGKEPNIDPLFQLDLDSFTEGPGLMMMAGRGAVAVHRMNLWLFYYVPISIFRSMLALPRSLLGSPPLLFLLALILRALFRDGLGAELPGADADKEEKSSETKDIVGMGMNAAKNFALTTFPTVFAVWRVVRDARADMYVGLCGVFVGLVLPVKIKMTVESAGGEEL